MSVQYPPSGQFPVHQPQPGPPLVTIGDITCTETTVMTPSGAIPIAGTTWLESNMTRSDTRIPAWAVVLAIIFFVFCLLGLLFLLVKEERTSGYIQVTVQGNRFMHTTNIPISKQFQVSQVSAKISYARALAMRAAH